MNVLAPWLKWLQKAPLLISDRYFRAEVRGWENLPDGPSLLVGNHNCGVLVNPEAWIFGAHYLASSASKNPLKALVHDLTLKIPVVSRIASEMGCIPANAKVGVAALKAGHRVLVYPGGGWESCRPSKDRDQIDFKGRTGFARLAQEAGVPIVPIVAAGAHDGWFIWTRGERIANFLRLNRTLRIDVFPLGLGFPLGVIVGPLFPFFPLPRKIILQILPPIYPRSTSGGESTLAKEVVTRMQSALDRLVEELPRTKARNTFGRVSV